MKRVLCLLLVAGLLACAKKDPAADVSGITLNKTDLVLAVGETETLTATLSPAGIQGVTVVWETTQGDIVSVTDGLILAVSEGDAVVSARAGSASASCRVKVRTGGNQDFTDGGEGQWSEGGVVTAYFEEAVPETKTLLDGMQVVWTKGDEIMLLTRKGLGDENEISMERARVLDECDGSRYGRFAASWDLVHKEINYGVYPAQDVLSAEYPQVWVNVPEQQEYRPGSFGQGANLAFGKYSNSSIVFYNVCGLLALQLTGTARISRIDIYTKGAEYLSGRASIQADFGTQGPTLSFKPSASQKKATLLCGGVQLSQNPTMFYIALPDGALAPGFMALVFDEDGGVMRLEGAAWANTVRRSAIRTMPTMNYAAGYTEEITGSSLVIVHNAETFTVPDLTDSQAFSPVLWGDGYFEYYSPGLSHRYSSGGEHRVTLAAESAKGCSFSSLEDIQMLDFTNF